MIPRIRRYRTGAPASTYTGRLSQLGLVAGQDLNLLTPGQVWLNDLASCPNLGCVTLACRLEMDTTQAVQLYANCIEVQGTGALLGGSSSGAKLFPGTDIKIDGAVPVGRILGPSFDPSNVSRGTPNDGGGMARGIMVRDGGRLELYGPVVAGLTNTTLADHAAASQNVLKLVGNCPWKSGDHILLGMSHFLQSLSQTNVTEEYVLSADATYDSGTNVTTVTLTSNVTYARWGKLQYGTGAGMSLTNDGYTAANLNGHVAAYLDSTGRTTYASEINAAIAAGRKNVADARAPVSLLTRKVKIYAPADTAFTGDERFGVHMMKMGNTGTFILDHIEIFNCGQGGALGRYPTHFHLNSIVANTSTIIGPVAAGSHSITNCSIYKSWNRIVSLHSIHGATFSNNVGWDARGHMLFLEDGAERDNTIDGNFMYHARDPGGAGTIPAPSGYRIKINDQFAAGGWFSNAHNTITNNRFSDAYVGRWLSCAGQRGGAYPGGCFGPSSYVNIQPMHDSIVVWDNNVTHSNYTFNARTSGTVYDEQGNTTNGTYGPTDTNAAGGVPIFAYFQNESQWKGNGANIGGANGAANNLNSGNSGCGSYENHVEPAKYEGWALFDNLGEDLSGAMALDTGFMHKSMFNARSLNVEAVQNAGVQAKTAFASYHALQKFIDNTFIGYQSGHLGVRTDAHYGVVIADTVANSWDLYINYPEFIGARNVGMHYIDSVPMWRCPPSWFIRHTSTYSAYVSSSAVSPNGVGGGGEGWTSPAIFDADGRLTQTGVPNSWMIFDHPALTANITTVTVPAQNGIPSFTKATTNRFFGAVYFNTDNPPFTWPAMVNYYDQFATVRCDPAASLADIAGTEVIPDTSYNGNGIFGGGGCLVCPVGQGFRLYLMNKPVPAASDIGTGVYLRLYSLRATVANGWADDDFGFVGVPWPNATTPSEVFIRLGHALTGGPTLIPSGYGKNALSPVASKAALLALTGEQFGYWQDTTNNIVWVRVSYPCGGLVPISPSANYYDTQQTMSLGVLK